MHTIKTARMNIWATGLLGLAVLFSLFAAAPAHAAQKMKLFIDTHDVKTETFPAGMTPEMFEGFFAQYEDASAEEGVVIQRVHVAYKDGRAFCFTMAPSADAVRRAHERVGLPIESITEVKTATPGDTFFRRAE